MSGLYKHLSVHKICILKGISKFTTPNTLDYHAFLHRIYTSGVEIRPVLKNFVSVSWIGECEKLILQKIIINYICKNNWSH